MQINQINKELYERAFIQNGEYGYHENATWTPSIDEREIEAMCEGEDGHYVPATPLGWRDYSICRRQGLENIFSQYPCVDLSEDDKLHKVRRADNTIRLYDKIKRDEDDFYVVVGDDEDKFFVVNPEGNLFCVSYLKGEKEKVETVEETPKPAENVVEKIQIPVGDESNWTNVSKEEVTGDENARKPSSK